MTKTTTLAEEMGVLHSPNLEKLTPAAARKLNEVLRMLDAEERESMVIMNAVGAWDWHMVDGTGRIWHFTKQGRMSWNMLNDAAERNVWRLAQNYGHTTV